MAGKTVLVTGGAGYIGSHTCRVLARAGCVPVVFDNLSEGHRWAVRYGPLVEGDLNNTRSIDDALKTYRPEAVIHFAASGYIEESMRDPQKYFRNNVAGTINLLDAMRVAGVMQIVFSSTCAIYGVPQSVPIAEEHPKNPVNAYGESKYFAERMLHWHAYAYGLQYVALRYFNAAGADPDGELGEDHNPETHLIPLTIQAALNSAEKLQVFGTDFESPDRTAIRDYVHVCDLADGHLAALRHLDQGAANEAINLGTGRGVSVREIIGAVERISGRSVAVEERPRRAGDPAVLVADPTKAASLLDWRPQRSDVATIVETAWNWHVGRSAAEESVQQQDNRKMRKATATS